LPAGGRTPSFSPPGGNRPNIGNRPSQLPAGGNRPNIGAGNRPSQLPAGGNRPNIGAGNRPSQLPAGGNRPNIGAGNRPSQLPAGGNRPNIGNRPTQLPSTRPDIGRPGVGNRPSQLPALGAGAIIGSGIGNRPSQLPAGGNRFDNRPGTLPGLGDGRPSQLPARTPGERRDDLRNRLNGDNLPGQLPNRDWNQVRNDWQDHRNDIREDWQSYRDQARNDWQDYLDDRYPWYGGWYGGYAPGYWGRWDYMWDNYPVAAAVGLTWWGANALGYGFGYSDYYNPYYAESMPAYCTEPVISMPVEYVQAPADQAAPAAPVVVAPTAPPPAVSTFDQARAAFYDGRYDEALKLTDTALTQLPQDAVLHEFRSLVLFALGRYAESAAVIHPVLDVGPGWDWKTLSSLYANVDTYTNQLRALETARDQNPKAADLYFLLGYHYLTCGFGDQAVDSFKRALALQPRDAVAAALVATLSPRDAQAAPPAAGPAPAPVPPEGVVGAWTASGPNAANYSMTLNKDGTFTWTFRRGARKSEAKGVYTVEGNVLAMEPDTGGVLVAELTAKGPDGLHFKMVGGAKDDPGLDFRKGPTAVTPRPGQ
jgi:tetratricopeptide (TPR) repeat protein